MNKYKNNLNLSLKVIDEEDLKDRLNLNYLDLVNKTHCAGKFDFPSLLSPKNVDIDYLALYSNKNEYNKTTNTCVCFYEYDDIFDNKNGLYNSIYYNDQKQLNSFKERFKFIKYIISPDYTLCGDCPEACNINNIFKSRVVSLWLTLECDKLVIPNITYASKKSFEYMLDGLEECEVIAFSTKGSLKNDIQRNLLVDAIRYSTDHLLNLKQIVVYDVSIENNKIYELFEYPKNKGIEILIPSNLLKIRNIYLSSYSHREFLDK